MRKNRPHFNIPIFLPAEGCRFRCVFCNQHYISGKEPFPTIDDIEQTILRHLQSFYTSEADVEIAFFGGNFTGLSHTRQKQLLDLACFYIDKGVVDGIRLSTRPDFIDEEKLRFLREYPVKTIELGAQSFDDHVLRKSGRGHTSNDIYKASYLIRDFGFELGLQMMTGLPGDTAKGALFTAEEIIRMGAGCTRIYPCLVIKDTALESLYRRGLYQPQSLEEAVRLAAQLIIKFEEASVKILKVGLHPAEGFISGNTLIAGPFHPAFREMSETLIWKKILEDNISYDSSSTHLTITTSPQQMAKAAGFKAYNHKWLNKSFKHVHFIADPLLKNREYSISYH